MKYEIKKFNDGQVTAKIVEDGDLSVCLRGNSYEDLFTAASIKEAWDDKNTQNKALTSSLTLYCLIGQRSDRRFNTNESFDLKIISKFINSMGYDRVYLLHPHSSVSLGLINNSTTISPYEYVKSAVEKIGNVVLISPDAGAYKTTYDIAQRLRRPLIASNKVRVNGEPIITLQGDVKDKSCLIVDDLADGGRTFKNLSEVLKEQGAAKVYLYVTHGQFHYGFEELKSSVDGIFCTNSYKNIEDSFVTQFKVI